MFGRNVSATSCREVWLSIVDIGFIDGAFVTYIIEARDPTEGATVMAVCRTRMEAAALWVKFRDEGLEDIATTDSAGHSISRHDLAKPADAWLPRTEII
jgi:hypothetical protein